MANQELGRIKCQECGGIAGVYQAKRKGNHLYTRCGECGVDQKTGKAFQGRLWKQTEWNPGLQPIKPDNVTESETEAETETVTDFDPTETEPETDAEPSKTGGAGLKVALGVLGVGGLLAAIIARV